MTIKKDYPIVGMHCSSCAKLIEKKISKLPGVTASNVNYGNETAFVESSKDIDAEVEKVVESLGYKVGKDVEKEKAIELKKLKIKVVVSGLAAIFLMAGMFPWFSYPVFVTISIALVIQIVIGWEFYQALISDIRNLSFGMNSLVAIGTTAAVIGGYYESSVTIIALILLGRFLEINAKAKTSDAIKKLMAIKGTKMESLKIGEIVKVRPGEKIATDGKIIDGESYVDQSLLTGESVPVKKIKGDLVYGGTINTTGSFSFKVTKSGSETLISQIIEMIRNAQGSRAEIQNLADKVSSYFVPIVIVIGIITFFVFGLTNAIAVLVIACPCAMGLATPTAVIVGVGRGATLGILIKDARALELLSRIKAIVFDKTGTLTFGKPVLINKIPKKYLQIAASLEVHSEHPIASAIVNAAKDIKLLKVEKFKALEGMGVEGIIDGKKYYLGKTNEASIALKLDDSVLAEFKVEDKIRPEAEETVAGFKKKKISVWMISGDNKNVAEKVAKQIGIDNVIAGVLPNQKAEKVKEIENTAFVGDGINDAPALATAGVGIAMGQGTDVAMESAGITLLGSKLGSVLTAYNLGRATISVIKQNLFWAFAYNTILIPVAAIGLLNPMFAAGAMALSSISVVGNSLRLKNIKI